MATYVRNNPQITDGKLTSEILWSLGRIGSFSVSKDGQNIVYDVKYYKAKENKGVSQFYTIKADGTDNKMITNNDTPKSSPVFLNNGKIAFLQVDDETHEMQLYQMNADGTDVQKLSNVKSGIDDFRFSPDNSHLIYVSQVKNIPSAQDIYPELDKTTGLIATDLMYLHWDHWMSTIPHPFVATYNSNEIGSSHDILNGTKYECPMTPFNSVSDLCWSPDGNTIAYIMKPSTGKEYAFHTHMDLYLYDIKTQNIQNLTENYQKDHGYLANPVFSPDGKKIAFGMMRRDGFEADVSELHVYDLEAKTVHKVNTTFKESVGDILWSNDSETIYFTGSWHGHSEIYRISLKNSEASQITTNEYDYSGIQLINGHIYAQRCSLNSPHDIVSIDLQTAKTVQLTYENKHIFDHLKLVKYEERWIKSNVDDAQIHSYVVYPPDFEPTKKYPAILFCTGGPQTTNANGWRYRWNLMLIASHGYVVVAPNRRGCTGFGIEWTEDVSMHFGGHAQDDLLSAIDSVSKEPFVDENRLGCVGASYGGYSVFFLESHHNKRFKVFVAHDGVFDFKQSYLETEEMWFAHHDIGSPWDAKTDPVVKQSYEYSPSNFLDKWDTPILVIHGCKDYRLTASQGMQAFNAAKMRGIPAKLLLFPDENHWCLKPQNSILWDNVFYDWLHQYLK